MSAHQRFKCSAVARENAVNEQEIILGRMILGASGLCSHTEISPGLCSPMRLVSKEKGFRESCRERGEGKTAKEKAGVLGHTSLALIMSYTCNMLLPLGLSTSP